MRLKKCQFIRMTLKMLHPWNPPNLETQIPRYRIKLNQNPNLNLYREIPRNLRLSSCGFQKCCILSGKCHRIPPKKLLGSEFSTPYTPFCLICTISSELKYLSHLSLSSYLRVALIHLLCITSIYHMMSELIYSTLYEVWPVDKCVMVYAA